MFTSKFPLSLYIDGLKIAVPLVCFESIIRGLISPPSFKTLSVKNLFLNMKCEWMEARRYLLTSLTNPANVHLVDLDEFDGYGECSCEHFQFRLYPRLRLGKRPLSPRCRHLRQAQQVERRLAVAGSDS